MGRQDMIDYAAARIKMVENQIRTTDVTSHSVLNAFLTVPREAFQGVDEIEVGMGLARAHRVTYVGELGWELHVPADLAAGVWRIEHGKPVFAPVRPASIMTTRGVPVCGHVGLAPQSVHMLGGYKVLLADTAGVLRQWDEIKAGEKGAVPRGLRPWRTASLPPQGALRTASHSRRRGARCCT